MVDEKKIRELIDRKLDVLSLRDLHSINDILLGILGSSDSEALMDKFNADIRFYKSLDS